MAHAHLIFVAIAAAFALALAPADIYAARPSSVDKAASPQGQRSATRVGYASYYGKRFHGKKTADGDTFDKNEFTAAHPSYPLGTLLRVTNLRNSRSVVVRINDRGPAPGPRSKGVIIDVSERAAVELGFRHRGKTRVRTEVLEWGEPKSS